MTIKLSTPMLQLLKVTPSDWQNLYVDSPTVEALRKRGLVEMRDRPGERGLMAGFQWRITEAGLAKLDDFRTNQATEGRS